MSDDPASTVKATDEALAKAAAAYRAADPLPFAQAKTSQMQEKGTGRVTGYSFSYSYPAPQYPNATIVENVVAQPDIRLPILNGIIDRPILNRGATSILSEPGYHRTERIFMDWQNEPLPLLPVAQAVALIDEYFGEFPYDSEGSRANFYAMALAGVLGIAIDGPKPLFVINKSTPRTGASLLAIALAWVLSCGSPSTTGGVARESEEMAKQIFAAGSNAKAVILFDNVDGLVRSPALDEYLTSTEYSGRRLGYND